MPNKHGEFIWYELMTRDPDAAKAFYDNVVGWNIGAQAPGDIDYRMIAAGEDYVGGVFTLTDDMCEHGARPVWLGYVGVDDVDATLAKLEKLGGSVLMPAKDIPDVGRLAMVADPQGTPFYVMRGAVEGGTSTAFQPSVNGHCSWNELTSSKQDASVAFYGELFGWSNDESMDMGDMGEYKLLFLQGNQFGAVSPLVQEDTPAMWTYYFYSPDIDAAVEKTKGRGGAILWGPHEVPGGDRALIARDPEGVVFGLVGK